MDTNSSPGFLRTTIPLRGNEIVLLLAMVFISGLVSGFGIGFVLETLLR